ncbi:reverse transcriptase domain-containing protein [Tanacetum coccineum]
MARQCTQPKRLRNAAWYKDKSMLAEPREAGQILDEEQLAFLADTRVLDAPEELPKISLVNESLKKLKFHLARFDNMVKIRTTPNAHSKASDEELEEPIEDQPLPADALSITLSPSYPEEDKEDPEEDPADYPANRGDKYDNESSDDDDDDGDVEKDEEEDAKEQLAPAGPSAIPTDDLEMMTTVNQGMSVEEIERVVAQRVANAIEAIAIYETKTNMARKSMSQTEQQEYKVAENASNKRKWEGNHNGSSSQQNKGHKLPRAHTTWPINKKAYAGTLPLCNRCKLHHNGQCTVKCGNCKKVGHMTRDCRNPAAARNQRTHTCYECGSLRHFKSECPIVKFQKRVDKKISTLAERQAENKRKLNNTSNNNQNQQQPNKRQNTGKAYTTWHGEKKHYSGSKLLCSKCNYHHDGPCAPKCHKCNRVGHLACDCRSSTNANVVNNQRVTGVSQKAIAMNVGIKGTAGVIARSKRTETMKTKLEYRLVGEVPSGHCVCREDCRIPWRNETLIIHGDGSNQGNVTRLNIISCTKTQKYMEKGFPIFLAHVTAKEVEDKSKKRLEDVPIVQDSPEVFPEDLADGQGSPSSVSTSGVYKMNLDTLVLHA